MITVALVCFCVLLFSPATGLLFKVPETVPIGHVIGYVEGSPKIATEPRYFVVYADEITEKYLRVDEKNGEIRTVLPLDFEKQRHFEILVIPIDGGGNGIQCTVDVEDVNNHAPRFPDDAITLEISEFARIGAEFPLPLAKDEDGPKYNVQKYRIVQGNVNNVFKIVSRRLSEILYADLVVNGQLDREYRDKYELVIDAEDGGKPAKTGRLRVQIAILDANDNPPVFAKPRYSISIPPSTSVGAKILTLRASDGDTGDNSKISYRLQKTRSNSLAFFSLSSSGVLSTTAHLLPGAVHDLVVAATDHGKPPLETTAFVSITVQGSSLDSPTFDLIWLTDSSTAHLPENSTLGSIVARISLNEKQQNSQVLLSGCPSICMQQSDSSNVYLLLICGMFDRETTSEYHLKFTMKQGEERILEHPVLLTIGDVNDNAPVWPQSSMHISLNRSGENFMSLTAIDPDQGTNGRIRYSILDSDVISIDPDTGRLIVADEVDCSTGNDIKFQIRAQDGGKPPLFSETTITADLIDPSARPPQFTKSFYEVLVKEDAEKGTCLLKVKANNSICGGSSRIRYSLQEKSNPDKIFSLDSTSGTICLEKQLDFEKIQSHQLSLIATDRNGLSGTSLALIRVVDVNDNSPIFHPTDYNISLREGVPPSGPIIAVSASDADTGSFGEISFSLVAKSSPFKVDSKSGELFVSRQLIRGKYDVIISASDGSGAKAERPAHVYVNVIGKDSESPSFTQSKYVIKTSEDILPGISIGAVQATGSGKISYSIYSGDPDHLFTINPDNGRITVMKYLDADKSNRILLNVQADLLGGASNHSQVLIEIEDHNDNSPVFLEDSVEVTIREDQPIHETFYVVQAEDRDRNKNGEMSYSLLSSYPSCPLLLQPLTGQLQLTAAIDYEKRKEYRIRIKATDHGVPPRSANMTIILHVSDVNDHAPTFEKSVYEIQVVENSPLMTEVLRLFADDEDSGEDGKIHYKMTNGSETFGVDSKTGSLFVKKELDREERYFYNLTVVAQDNGQPPRSSTAVIRVSVLDVNDNAPSCTSVQTLVVPSDADTVTPFGSIVVLDADSGENGTVVYKTHQPHTLFQLSANGDVLLRRPLRDSDATDFRLAVIVSDQGTPKKSAVCHVPIKITRGTTNVVLVKPVQSTVRVPAGCQAACRLTKINATGVEKWQIQSSAVSTHFSVTNGIVSLHSLPSPLPPWSLTLLLFDKEGRQKHVSLKVLPAVSKNLRESLIISPSTPIGSKIAVIGEAARDDQWYYTISNQSDLFELDEVSGNVYLSGKLKEHSGQNMHIYFEKINTADYNTEDIEIEFQISENALETPVFEEERRKIDISEDTPIESFVTTVSATVSDPLVPVHYRLNSPSSLFAIDQYNGDVTLMKALDWFEQAVHYVVVEAYTKTTKSSMLLEIHVVDVNNNRPDILSDDVISVLPGSGRVVHTVVATDRDSGANGQVIYDVIYDPEHNFSIDQNTGELSMEEFPKKDGSITIRTSDRGSPPLFTDQILKIRVADSGKRWRFFAKPEFVWSTTTTKNIGEVIGKVHGNGEATLRAVSIPSFLVFDGANFKLKSPPPEGNHRFTVLATSKSGDIDWSTVLVLVTSSPKGPRISSASCGSVTVAENQSIKDLKRIVVQGEGKIEFRIQGRTSVFEIESKTGVISCSELDRETKAEHLLVIVAAGDGKNDSCTVRVSVKDENDNAPQFSAETPQLIHLNDSFGEGKDVISLSAIDLDSGANGRILYDLMEDPSNIFDLDPESGKIKLARNLPHSQKEWMIRVRVTDGGESPLSSDRFIRVRDGRESTRNEETQPSFLRSSYVTNVDEGQDGGQQVAKVSTSSRDSRITYSIVEGNVDSAFAIDSDGVVRTAQELDHEIRPDYKLRVIGTGSFPGEIATQINVKVNNLNDNPPAFPKMRTRKISEALPIGSYVTTATANDVDMNDVIEYSLEEGEDRFVIDRYTGVVHSQKLLDYEMSKEISLKIMATDGKHQATTDFHTNLLDENDNSPVFPQNFYDIQIPPFTQINDVVVKLLATDADSGENGQVSYSVRGDGFTIDDEGNLRLLSSVAVGFEYLVTVTATDHGTPRMTSSVPVRITVSNNQPTEQPVFPRSSYEFLISEKTLPHTVIGNVSIGNHPMWYRIIDTEAVKWFTIDRFGRLYSKLQLDHEKRDFFSFEVDVGSGGSGFHQNSTTSVIVRISDVNDNSPVFSTSFAELVLKDGMVNGDTLLRLSATDADSGDNGKVSYGILSGNDHGIFSLNSESGALMFNEWNDDVFTRHQNGSWITVVEAKDHGNPSRSTLLSLNVVVSPSWSGTAPFFVQSKYVAHVEEGCPSGTVVFVARAINRAGIRILGLTYSLKENSEFFSIDSLSGAVQTTAELDFESRASYDLTLVAADQKSRAAVVSLEIRVLPIDEYPPTFTKERYTFQIPIDSPVGSVVGSVRAVDADGGVDGIVRYSVQDTYRLVEVHEKTGQITLLKSVADHKNLTIEQFTIIAASGTLLETHATVYLEIGPFHHQSSPFASTTFKIAALATVTLFCCLLILLVCCVCCRRSKVKLVDNPHKQVFSVSKGHLAIPSNMSRMSPSYGTKPLPSNVKPKTSSMTSSASTSSGLRSALSQRDFVSTRSQPDSGIDPDTVSINSSVTEYLVSIGVNPNPIPPRPRHRRRDTVDSQLNELIYARVDDVIGPGPIDMSRRIDSFEQNPIGSRSTIGRAPSFQPLTEIFQEVTKMQEEEKMNPRRDYVQIEI